MNGFFGIFLPFTRPSFRAQAHLFENFAYVDFHLMLIAGIHKPQLSIHCTSQILSIELDSRQT